LCSSWFHGHHLELLTALPGDCARTAVIDHVSHAVLRLTTLAEHSVRADAHESASR